MWPSSIHRRPSEKIDLSRILRSRAFFGCCGTIYQKVGTAFQDAARARGEILPAAIQDHIVLLFSPVSNDGEGQSAFFDEHVAYEAAKKKWRAYA